jgi:hypothetical protein
VYLAVDEVVHHSGRIQMSHQVFQKSMVVVRRKVVVVQRK